MRILFDRKKFKRFLAVLVLLIFLSIISFSSWGQGLLSRVVNPSSSFFRKNSQDLSGSNKSRAELLADIENLKEELILKDVDSSKIYILEEENEKLRQYLEFFDNNSLKYVLANVVWQENFLNFSQYNQNIVIDRGSKDGLYEGLAVINNSGVIIGKIIEVSRSSSRVCLINNNFCKMAVSITNSYRTIGLAEGDLGLSIKINFVPQSEDVNVGDQIISSGLEKDIPRGLLVGRINSVEQDVNDIWQNVNAEALFDVNNLNIVSIVLP